MFCEKCGKEVLDEAVICVHCGCSLKSNTNSDVNNEPLDTGVKVLSFCFPIVGIILYFVHQNSAPQKSKDACHMALWSFGFSIVLNILVAIIGGF
tara:strand:- start:102 stop:386 length:285 start_codon:yes stop_codon:yes gene_type:complete